LAVSSKDAPIALELLQSLDITKNAAIIGKVSMKKEGKVILHSAYGSSRYLDLPKGELLPRIC
jgi:hydrogenase expression/formation protein HypE